MLSQTAEYALRAVLYLAEHGSARAVGVGEIARALGIPQNYLAKTLNQLARDGVLVSARGKTGGFRLSAPPRRIPLGAVVDPFERLDQRRRCLLGRAQCSARHACAAHDRWQATGERIARFFRDTTVADLLPARASA